MEVAAIQSNVAIERSERGQPSPSPTFGIFILGAGFSRPAGMPLGPELWREVRHRAVGTFGPASKFSQDLGTYIDYKRECDGEHLSPDNVDFEDFLAFLDVEYHLGLRGSDTWSDDGNETQVMVKTLIGQILTERMPPKGAIPELYLQFAKALRANDYVLTFNYDPLLELALEAVGQPFRLFPQRYRTVYRGSHSVIDNSREEIVVLKLHGSIDWFDRGSHRRIEENSLRLGLSEGPAHPIFKTTEPLDVVPIVDGPRFPDDPLSEIHRVREIEKLYRNPPFFRAAPVLLPPSSAKILYARQFSDFWYGLGKAGGLNFRMAIIGYSLPHHDDYARQVIYRLVKNYQQSYWSEDVLGLRKTPLVIVDLRQPGKEQEEFLRRYAFVDWSKAKADFGGFGEASLVTLGL